MIFIDVLSLEGLLSVAVFVCLNFWSFGGKNKLAKPIGSYFTLLKK